MTRISLQRALAPLLAGGLAGLALLASPAAHADDTSVGVSVSVAQPGFYGRVDIGNQPPALIYPQPVIIQQTPIGMQQRPIYMHVPPGHYRNWARYCNIYRACGQPVYFVRDDDRWGDRRGWDRHGRGDHGDRDGDRGYYRDRGDDDHGDHGHGHGHD